MAIFNDQPDPTRDQNFLNWSKPIGDVPANQSGAIALNTAASAIGLSAELADSAVKGVIKSDTAKKVDPLRDAYTASLEAINNGDNTPSPQAAQGIPTGVSPMVAQSTYGYTPQSAGNPQNLLPDNTNPTIPGYLSSKLDKLSVMAQAQRLGGHYNDTQYTADLTDIAKQMRSQYPGYRDYVDEEISKVSGVPIANALVKNLQEDANRAASNTKSEQEKTLAFIRSNIAYDGSDQVYANFAAGKISTNQVMTWAASNAKVENDLKLKQLAMNVDQGTKKANDDATLDFANAFISNQATTYYRNAKLAGGRTPEQMADTLTDIQMHPERIDSVNAQVVGQQYEAARADYTNKTMKMMSMPGADGKSVIDKLGATKVKELVDANGGALFDASSKLAFNKDYGSVHMAQTLSDGIVSQQGLGILQSSIGKETANVVAFTKMAPTIAPLVWSNMTELGFGTQLYNFTASQTNKAMTQNTNANDGSGGTSGPGITGGGPAYTFKQSVQEQKKLGQATGTEPSPLAIQKLADLRNVITNPKSSDELRINAFTYFFNPANMDTLSEFKEGYYDPAQKRMIQGREGVFAALTSKDITDQAYAMKNAGHPEVWDNYKNWAEHEAGVHLIRNDVGNLNDALNGTHFHISWDTEHHKIGITNPDGTPLHDLQLSPLNMPYRSVTNINNVLGNMQNIAKAEGTNVDAYLYRTLSNINGDAARKLQGAIIVGNGGKAPTPPVSQ